MIQYCLCTLPPQRTPYTCLCLYAISNVPQCTSCSAPCASFEPNCCESNPYQRALHVADVALGSCAPIVCAPSLYTELAALQTDIVPLSCASMLDGLTTTTTTSADCTGNTYYEHAIEQRTTVVYVLAQQAQQRQYPVFNKTSLYNVALHQNASHWLCESLHTTDVSLVRTVYHVYQNVNTILKQLHITLDVCGMDRCAIQFAYTMQSTTLKQYETELDAKRSEQRLGREVDTGWYPSSSVSQFDAEQNVSDAKSGFARLKDTLEACQKHYHTLQHLRTQYAGIEQQLEVVLTAVGSACRTFWCNPTACVVTTTSAATLFTDCLQAVRIDTQSVPIVLQTVNTSLEAIATYIQDTEMQSSFSWDMPLTVVSRTVPSLDAHIQQLAHVTMQMESNQHLQSSLGSFLTKYFCDSDGAVSSTTCLATVWHTSCDSLKIHLSELRHRIALSEAVQ